VIKATLPVRGWRGVSVVMVNHYEPFAAAAT
jgi:hypothetical protein